MKTRIFKYRLLQILSFCAAVAFTSIGFNSPDVIASSVDKLEKIAKKDNKSNSSIDQFAGNITEEITNRILPEIKTKFDSYYGSHVVTGATAHGGRFTYYLSRENQAARDPRFTSELPKEKVGKNFATISKAKVRWDDKYGVMIDYMNSNGDILATECHLDIRPLLKLAETNRHNQPATKTSGN